MKIINPPAAFLMQNKSVLALIWQLYEEEVFFEEEERGIIQKYFLPTYFTNKTFIEKMNHMFLNLYTAVKVEGYLYTKMINY